MKDFLIHCPDNQSKADARDFFRKMFEGSIIIDNDEKLVTTVGITIRYMAGDKASCGLKLNDFLTLTNKHEHPMYDRLYMSTLG